MIRFDEADARAPRADAARNRDMLLAAATRAFASAEAEPSMRAIAREAGVGIATLYRHFPPASPSSTPSTKTRCSG